MRILQVHNRYRQPGGEDVVVDGEATVLRAAGNEVRQLVEHNPSGNVASAVDLLLAPWNPSSAARTRVELDRYPPDVAHIHNTWFALSPSVLTPLRVRKVPVVATLHNYRLTCGNGLLFRDGEPCELCLGTSPWPAVRHGCYRGSRLASVPAALTIQLHRWLKTWERVVDVWIVMTRWQRNLMLRAGIPEGKTVVLPHFVADPGPRPGPPSRSNLILFVGRLTREKGVRLLIDAWGREPPRGLRLLIVGDGPDFGALGMDLPQGVEFVGRLPRDEVGNLMLQARALVMPSIWPEPFGRVVAEAFAAGLPTLVSDNGGPGELVAEGIDTDWLFKSGDESFLASALQRLVEDDMCDEAGIRARFAFEQHFSSDGAADRLIGVYERAIAADATARREASG